MKTDKADLLQGTLDLIVLRTLDTMGPQHAYAIASRLEQHKKDQEKQPANWGYAGDLDHISNELAYILASLGDRSAVDAKGLEY